jgi:hypothetical protein
LKGGLTGFAPERTLDMWAKLKKRAGDYRQSFAMNQGLSRTQKEIESGLFAMNQGLSRTQNMQANSDAIQDLPWHTKNRWYRAVVILVGMILIEGFCYTQIQKLFGGKREIEVYPLLPRAIGDKVRLKIEGCSVVLTKPFEYYNGE